VVFFGKIFPKITTCGATHPMHVGFQLSACGHSFDFYSPTQ
jgi:hypothetical protein